jgi:small-conductance mechanosensitive channel
LTPQQAAQALQILEDDKRRAELLQALRVVAQVSPVAPPVPAKPPSPPPATKPQAPVSLVPSGLGTELLGGISNWLEDLSRRFGDTARAVTDFPLLWRWVLHVVNDPVARQGLFEAAWRLAVVVGCGLAAEWLTALALRRPLAVLEAHAPPDPANGLATAAESVSPATRHRSRAWRLLQRLPFAIGRLILDLLPVLAFAAVADGLLATIIDSTARIRLIILAMVGAYIVCRTVMCLTRMLASPGHRRLALLQFGDETAAYVEIWVRRITVVAAFGTALAQVALLLGLYPAAHEALLKIVALIVHIFLVIIVLQCRRTVANGLRAPDEARGVLAGLRNRLADIWHYVAIFFILASWFVWAVQVRNGFARLLDFFVSTIVILFVFRLVSIVALGSLDRLFRLDPAMATRYPGLEARANRYYPVLRGVVSAVVWALMIVALLESWGFHVLVWFRSGELGRRLLSSAITVTIASVAAILVWESANASMERHLARLRRDAQLVRATRLQTLLPMLKTTLLIAILAVVGLTALSEIGINIGPLLAGAGIVGVAIGFGSQKLVQDLITGIFLLLENAMQVGDWVTVSGLSGSVENLSIRTIRLRAGDGSVHIIPFSAVTSVTNTNRGIGNAAVSVIVAIGEDTDHVGEVMKQIATEMRDDPSFKPAMRSDLQLWGVDKVDASGVTIVGQIECTDAGRWGVQREFNRRMKKRFDELGIQLALPAQSVLLQNAAPEKPAEAEAGAEPGPEAPSMRDQGSDPGRSSASTPESPPPAALGNTS